MLILALDPSSTCTGYAFMGMDGKIIDAGLLKPDNRKDSPSKRIETMCKELQDLLVKHKSKFIVIEWPSGHVGKKRHKGGGAGLATYGIAVGAVWQTVKYYSQKSTVVLIREDEWTKEKPKRERIKDIKMLYPEYQADKDLEGDMADAMGLGRHFLIESKIKDLIQ